MKLVSRVSLHLNFRTHELVEVLFLKRYGFDISIISSAVAKVRRLFLNTQISAAALIKLISAKVLRLIDHLRYTSFALGLCVSVCWVMSSRKRFLGNFFFGPFYMTKLSVCGPKLMPEGAVLVRKERLKFSGHAQILKTSDKRSHFWHLNILRSLFRKSVLRKAYMIGFTAELAIRNRRLIFITGPSKGQALVKTQIHT